VINELSENGVRIYELDDLDINNPLVTFSNDAPAVVEVGQTIATVIFSGSIVAGTYPIASRSISPDPGGLNLAAPFTFNKTAVKRTSAGNAETHEVTAIDDQGNSTVVASQVVFKDAVYMGYSELATLTAGQIQALTNKDLVDTIISEYGGEKSYVVPAGVPKYIYWAAKSISQAIAAAESAGFIVPLAVLSPVALTNIHDGAIVTNYWVIRTANKFYPGTYQIYLT
jgi:hypothetical protein